MIDLHSTFLNAIQQQSYALTTCWSITRRDGVIERYCDSDQDVVIGGFTYLASNGFLRSASESKIDGEPQNVNVSSFFDASGITSQKLRSGIYQMARVLIFLVNRLDLPDALPSNKMRVIGRCVIRGASSDSLQFTIQLRSISDLFNNTIGFEITETCSNDFCDVGANPYSACRLNQADYTTPGVITSVTNEFRIFRWGVSGEPEGEYDNGLITFISGENSGFRSRVQYYSGSNQEFALYDLTPFPMRVGDSFLALVGCLKTREDCLNRFNNLANIAAAYTLPGLDIFVNPDSEPA